MKKINRNIICIGVLMLLLSACQKTDKKYTITSGSFSQSSSLKATTTAPALADSIQNDTATIFTWSTAVFGDQGAVSYVLQIDVPSDTVGDSAWSKAVSYSVNNATRLGLIVQDLNTVASNLKMTIGTAGYLAVRVKAIVYQNSGTPSTVLPTYTNTLLITVVPYSLTLYVPNSYQSFTFTAATPTLNVVPDSSGIYEGYIYLGSSTTGQSFKYTNAPDFVHVNYGDAGSGMMTTDGTAPSMGVSSGGYYEVTANFKTNAWTATKTTWALIGDATAKGWTADNEMTYNDTTKVWTVTTDFVTAGSFKFRANDAWSIDFGVPATYTVGDLSGPLVYVDNPFFLYNPQGNLSVAVAGNYTVTLDLHVSGHYTFSLHKN